MTDVLNFDDLTPIEIPVRMQEKDYFLREATGGAAKTFHNARVNRVRFGAEGKASGIKDIGDLEPLLVSSCLWDSNNKRVPQAVIESWPARVVKELFEKAKEISQLDEEETEESLTKDLEETQKKLDELRKKEESVKNGLDSTEDGFV